MPKLRDRCCNPFNYENHLKRKGLRKVPEHLLSNWMLTNNSVVCYPCYKKMLKDYSLLDAENVNDEIICQSSIHNVENSDEGFEINNDNAMEKIIVDYNAHNKSNTDRVNKSYSGLVHSSPDDLANAISNVFNSDIAITSGKNHVSYLFSLVFISHWK